MQLIDYKIWVRKKKNEFKNKILQKLWKKYSFGLQRNVQKGCMNKSHLPERKQGQTLIISLKIKIGTAWKQHVSAKPDQHSSTNYKIWVCFVQDAAGKKKTYWLKNERTRQDIAEGEMWSAEKGPCIRILKCCQNSPHEILIFAISYECFHLNFLDALNKLKNKIIWIWWKISWGFSTKFLFDQKKLPNVWIFIR